VSRSEGRKGEAYGAQILIDQGYLILDKNYQNRYGEIDLIAKDGEVLVFIEVKAWKQYGFEDLEFSINQAKQKKIIGVAKDYLYRNGLIGNIDVRFDVLFIDSRTNHFEIIQNAFTETGKL